MARIARMVEFVTCCALNRPPVCRDARDRNREPMIPPDMTGELDRLVAAARRWAPMPMALATVISTWGSAPRPRGSHMLVAADGRFEGSVSGGCVEGEVLAAAAETIADRRPRRLRFDVAEETAWSASLPCGGEIAVLVQPVGDGRLPAPTCSTRSSPPAPPARRSPSRPISPAASAASAAAPAPALSSTVYRAAAPAADRRRGADRAAARRLRARARHRRDDHRSARPLPHAPSASPAYRSTAAGPMRRSPRCAPIRRPRW